MKFSKKGLLVTDIEFRTHYTEAKLAGFSVCFFRYRRQDCLAGGQAASLAGGVN